MGTLYTQEGPITAHGVIILPGSDGGVPEAIARRMSQSGYCSLALGYFSAPGLPSYLENIELEYIQRAIQHFKEVPQVKQGATILLGYSRGAELALLIASFFPELVDGVVAIVPSSYVGGAFPYLNRPAWLLQSRPIAPYLPALTSRDDSLTEAEDLFQATREGKIPFHYNTPEDPYQVVDFFLARHRAGLEALPIPVEKIQCPLLLFAGEEDAIWPSALYVRKIEAMLDQHSSPIARKSMIYPHAGHGLLFPYNKPIHHPVGRFWCTLGGSVEGNNAACHDLWEQLHLFLAQFS